MRARVRGTAGVGRGNRAVGGHRHPDAQREGERSDPSDVARCGARHTADSKLSPGRITIEHMCESLLDIDTTAGESALVERIAALERLKSAAAAGQDIAEDDAADHRTHVR